MSPTTTASSDPAANSARSSSTGRLVRLGIGLRVVAMVVLAAIVAGLATWLAERRGLHGRFDLTASSRNTLQPALAELISKLPDSARIEVFFRPEAQELRRDIALEVQGRMHDLLVVAQNEFPDKIELVDHDLADVGAAAERLGELELQEDQIVVVESGGQRAVLRLWTDLATFDLGNPNPNAFVPPRVTSFRGEEALAFALRKVSRGAAPKIYFTTGHGELDLFGEGQLEIGKLRSVLFGDGVEAQRWDAAESDLPEDADVVAIIGADNPLLEREVQAIEVFLARGGGLLVAAFNPDLTDNSVASLLARHGVRIDPSGLVANPVPAANGQLYDGTQECANLVIGSSGLAQDHQITAPLWRSGNRSVIFAGSRALTRGTLEGGATYRALARSGVDSWLDREDSRPGADKFDWSHENGVEEVGPFDIAVAVARPLALSEDTDEGERKEARIVALGTPAPFTNSMLDYNLDLALNAFNWLATRDARLGIAPRSDDRRILPIGRGEKLRVVHRVAALILPGLAALLGALVWWRRRT